MKQRHTVIFYQMQFIKTRCKMDEIDPEMLGTDCCFDSGKNNWY